MPLYPTLEDLKVSELIESQDPEFTSEDHNSFNQLIPVTGLYPSLSNFMGFDLATINNSNTNSPLSNAVIAPISQQNTMGIKRAEVRPGMRKIVLCKDAQGKIGLGVKQINNGIFVSMVYVNSPAALAGMRFGDQILEINEQIVSGYSTDKAKNLIRQCSSQRIEIVIRDRPLERTITVTKSNAGYIGFTVKQGEITALVKDSSAARNGVLTEHQLIEVDGQCVVGMNDRQMLQVVEAAPRTVTLTIMPRSIYKHIVKCIGENELRKFQDHSIPEI